MSNFFEGGASELRDLFFESASELLQALNDEGLELERAPQDPEIVRNVRRTVHTLKGDSAACGYTDLSDLAHALEDALTPEIARSSNGRLAELVLEAADVFADMLAAYRTGTDVASGKELRDHIHQLMSKPAPENIVPYQLQGRFAWTEYEQMSAEEAATRGLSVFNIALAVDPHCPLPAAALQMARNVLSGSANVLAMQPDAASAATSLDVIEACISTRESADYFRKRCLIPAMISDVLVEQYPLTGNVHASTPGAAAAVEPKMTIAPAESKQTKPVQAVSAPALGSAPHTVNSDHSLLQGAAGLDIHSELSAPSRPQPAEKPVVASAAIESMLRVDAERIDAVLNLVGELIIGKSMLMQSVGEFDKRFVRDPLRARFADAMAFQARVLSDLQKSVMKIRMVPIEQLFRRFPRLVRDTAKACGKEAELIVRGEETDLDKSILDLLHEPLAHLVRNAVDHGIEAPLDRMAQGKPTQGSVRLNAYHQGNQIVIEICDDGRGMDRNRLVARAVERGILSHEESQHLSDAEAFNLAFHPGLSTAEQVTTISGRGVGMDIVKTAIERLKGTVNIESRPRAGTTFLIKVPLTLAIIKALMFRVSDRQYAVPLNSVVEITRASESQVHRVDQHEVIQLRDSVLTLVRLAKLEKLRPSASNKFFVIVITLQDRKFGLVVDKLVGEEELVIKPLDDQLVATELVSGASILGDGNVVLILNTSALVARLGRTDTATRAKGATA